MNNDILVRRQPIFNTELEIVAYELLFRSSGSTQAAEFDDGDKATSKLILNTFLDFGLENIVAHHTAFINLTRTFLLRDELLPFNKDQVVLEILEDIEIDDEIVASVSGLHKSGYTIALDDYIFDDAHSKIIPYISIIKIDILGMTQAQIEEQVKNLEPFKVKLLAEKIENQEEFEFCKSLGFEMFQGFFLSKPRVMSRQKIPTNRLSILKFMAQLSDEDITVKQMEESISTDVSLSYRLLKYINSSFFGLRTRIESLNHALSLLGRDKIRQWVSLIALSGINDKPNHLIITAMLRAKICSLLAEQNNISDSSQYFTAGLFSNLPVIMDMSIEDVVADIHLAEPVVDALLHYKGDVGRYLKLAIAVEQAKWDSMDLLDFDIETINHCYLEAIAWTNQIMDELLK